MAVISALGDSFNVSITTLVLTPTVIALDALVAASTSGVINAGTYHIANSVPLHILTSAAGTSATAAATLFMPGERCLTIGTGMRVSIIKSAGAADGLFRATQVA